MAAGVLAADGVKRFASGGAGGLGAGPGAGGGVMRGGAGTLDFADLPDETVAGEAAEDLAEVVMAPGLVVLVVAGLVAPDLAGG